MQGSRNPPDSVRPDLKTQDKSYIEGRGNMSAESVSLNLGLTLSSVEKTQPNYLPKGHVLDIRISMVEENLNAVLGPVIHILVVSLF